MTNPGENKNRDHISTRVSFNFIHYMANLLGWGGAKWQNGSLLYHFQNKIPYTKKILASALSFFYLLYKFNYCLQIVPPHALFAGGGGTDF